jgi:hypothetical protein
MPVYPGAPSTILSDRMNDNFENISLSVYADDIDMQI